MNKKLILRKFDYNLYDIEGPLNDVIENLQKARDEFETSGITNLQFKRDDSGYDSVSYCIEGYQLETDEEFNERIKKEEKISIKKKQDKLKEYERRKKQYEKLKKEFDK